MYSTWIVVLHLIRIITEERLELARIDRARSHVSLRIYVFLRVDGLLLVYSLIAEVWVALFSQCSSWPTVKAATRPK